MFEQSAFRVFFLIRILKTKTTSVSDYIERKMCVDVSVCVWNNLLPTIQERIEKQSERQRETKMDANNRYFN